MGACERQPIDISLNLSLLKDFVYLFLERGEGREKEREGKREGREGEAIGLFSRGHPSVLIFLSYILSSLFIISFIYLNTY